MSEGKEGNMAWRLQAAAAEQPSAMQTEHQHGHGPPPAKRRQEDEPASLVRLQVRSHAPHLTLFLPT